MLAFVNNIMLILAKYAEIMHLLFSSNLVKYLHNYATNKQVEIHFPYLHPGKLRVHH